MRTLSEVTASQITRENLSLHLFAQSLTKGTQTKIKIVEATIKTIAESGVFKLTYEKVANQLGLNRGQIKYHFPELEKLMICSLKFITMTAHTATTDYLEQVQSKGPRIYCYIDAMLAWIKQYPKHAKALVLIYHLASYDDSLKELHSSVRTMGKLRIEKILMREYQEMTAEQVGQISNQIQGCITGFLLEHLTTKNLSIDDAERLIKTTIKQFLVN